jgi:hypothetical protein
MVANSCSASARLRAAKGGERPAALTPQRGLAGWLRTKLRLAAGRLLVALDRVRVLFLCAKHLFVAARRGAATMPLRFSSLRRGCSWSPSIMKRASPINTRKLYASYSYFSAKQISQQSVLLWKIATPWQWEFRRTSIMRSSLRSISSRRYSRGSRQLARARISFRDNPLNAWLRREPGYGSSL